jgi:hypothetical protein
MHERFHRSAAPKADRLYPRGWRRAAFISSIPFLFLWWVSSLCFSLDTNGVSYADHYSRAVVLLTQQNWKRAAIEFQ